MLHALERAQRMPNHRRGNPRNRRHRRRRQRISQVVFAGNIHLVHAADRRVRVFGAEHDLASFHKRAVRYNLAR